MLRHAIDHAPTLQLAQACGHDWQPSEDLEQRLEPVHKDLRFADADPFARVDTSPDGDYSVEVNDSYFSYRPAANAFEFSCWGNAPPIN